MSVRANEIVNYYGKDEVTDAEGVTYLTPTPSFAERNPNAGLWIAGGVVVLGLVGAGTFWWWTASAGAESEGGSEGEAESEKPRKGRKERKGKAKGVTEQQARTLVLKKAGAQYTDAVVESIEQDAETGEWLITLQIGPHPAGEFIVRSDGTVLDA